MARTTDHMTQSFVAAPTAASLAVARACRPCDASGQKAFGKSIG